MFVFVLNRYGEVRHCFDHPCVANLCRSVCTDDDVVRLVLPMLSVEEDS